MFKGMLMIPELMLKKQSLMRIIEFNDKTIEYGLKLSEEDAKSLIETRSEALNSNGRIEFGGGVIQKILEEFCDSPFISQYNYVETINELIETFYYYKNETLELISDEELIHLMKEYYDKSCYGSVELLQNRELYKLADNIKHGVRDYLNIKDYEIEEDEDFDE